ncbi:MAG TPA: hypothetical protein VE422_36825 [Terriglobia bacterium]|nr:hypothetical protein [Terriglobia bacterium]
MFCDRCGAKLDDLAAFCSGCGKGVGTSPPMPRQGRIAGHLRLLGILWIALSAFRLIPGFVLFVIFRSAPFPPEVPRFVLTLLPMIGFLLLVSAVIGGIVGIGLLTRQPWARMLAIVFGSLNLFDLPFGTALGVYTLWVLLPPESEQEYHSKVRAPA